MVFRHLILAEHLIAQNATLINKTGMANCHCIGLNSFIINEKPRIRLFIANESCELYQNITSFDPIIPIHAHKYQDMFLQLEGATYHCIYKKRRANPIGRGINKYTYNRLNNTKNKIELLGEEILSHIETICEESFYLEANTLHTVYLSPDKEGKCSWLVIECKEDSNFEQVCYHQNLIEREELYQPLPNSHDFLLNYFE